MTNYPARKDISWQIKAYLYHKQDGLCAGCGATLELFKPRAVHADHNPALTIRPLNEDGTDYDPPQLDPNYIDLLGYECCHKEKSKDDTTRGAKAVRQGKKHRGEVKAKKKIPSPADPWGKEWKKKIKEEAQ